MVWRKKTNVFSIKTEQIQVIAEKNEERQLRNIFLTYANELRPHDPALAAYIFTMTYEKSLALFSNIYNLTKDKLYQRALLAISASTEIDFFKTEEFSFIINHRFLCGDAKARHIIFSSLANKIK